MNTKLAHKILITLLALQLFSGLAAAAADCVVYDGNKRPGKGRHIVFLSGDEEYRSEEGLPQLARILAFRHGFKCTVLFSINKSGEIDPNTGDNEPGMEALDSADLCVMLLRFRHWPDEQMKHFVDYYLAGKPIIALRTSTHAFDYGKNPSSAYARFGWQGKEWPGGFGRHVLGETWVAHHGGHKSEATRGVIEPSALGHPILRGVTDIFGDTDVYTANPLPDSEILVRGQVLKGMHPTDPPVEGKKNSPMQPVVWLRYHSNEAGKTNRVLTTTMGSATDLQNEGLRRLIVNGAFWALGWEKKIKARTKVDLVGEFKPTMYGFGSFKKGVKPADHEMATPR